MTEHPHIVTGMFWEYFQNPIYMHLHHIFFVSRIGGAISIISAWPIWLSEVHHFAIQLLPISCCQYMYANFVSVVGGALRIIMVSPFIPYLSTYLGKCSLLSIFYIRLRRRLHFSNTYSLPFHLPEYILSKCSLYVTPEYILVIG